MEEIRKKRLDYFKWKDVQEEPQLVSEDAIQIDEAQDQELAPDDLMGDDFDTEDDKESVKSVNEDVSFNSIKRLLLPKTPFGNNLEKCRVNTPESQQDIRERLLQKPVLYDVSDLSSQGSLNGTTGNVNEMNDETNGFYDDDNESDIDVKYHLYDAADFEPQSSRKKSREVLPKKFSSRADDLREKLQQKSPPGSCSPPDLYNMSALSKEPFSLINTKDIDEGSEHSFKSMKSRIDDIREKLQQRTRSESPFSDNVVGPESIKHRMGSIREKLQQRKLSDDSVRDRSPKMSPESSYKSRIDDIRERLLQRKHDDAVKEDVEMKEKVSNDALRYPLYREFSEEDINDSENKSKELIKSMLYDLNELDKIEKETSDNRNSSSFQDGPGGILANSDAGSDLLEMKEGVNEDEIEPENITENLASPWEYLWMEEVQTDILNDNTLKDGVDLDKGDKYDFDEELNTKRISDETEFNFDGFDMDEGHRGENKVENEVENENENKTSELPPAEDSLRIILGMNEFPEDYLVMSLDEEEIQVHAGDVNNSNKDVFEKPRSFGDSEKRVDVEDPVKLESIPPLYNLQSSIQESIELLEMLDEFDSEMDSTIESHDAAKKDDSVELKIEETSNTELNLAPEDAVLESDLLEEAKLPDIDYDLSILLEDVHQSHENVEFVSSNPSSQVEDLTDSESDVSNSSSRSILRSPLTKMPRAVDAETELFAGVEADDILDWTTADEDLEREETDATPESDLDEKEDKIKIQDSTLTFGNEVLEAGENSGDNAAEDKEILISFCAKDIVENDGIEIMTDQKNTWNEYVEHGADNETEAGELLNSLEPVNIELGIDGEYLDDVIAAREVQTDLAFDFGELDKEDANALGKTWGEEGIPLDGFHGIGECEDYAEMPDSNANGDKFAPKNAELILDDGIVLNNDDEMKYESEIGLSNTERNDVLRDQVIGDDFVEDITGHDNTKSMVEKDIEPLNRFISYISIENLNEMLEEENKEEILDHNDNRLIQETELSKGEREHNVESEMFDNLNDELEKEENFTTLDDYIIDDEIREDDESSLLLKSSDDVEELFLRDNSTDDRIMEGFVINNENNTEEPEILDRENFAMNDIKCIDEAEQVSNLNDSDANSVFLESIDNDTVLISEGKEEKENEDEEPKDAENFQDLFHPSVAKIGLKTDEMEIVELEDPKEADSNDDSIFLFDDIFSVGSLGHFEEDDGKLEIVDSNLCRENSFVNEAVIVELSHEEFENKAESARIGDARDLREEYRAKADLQNLPQELLDNLPLRLSPRSALNSVTLMQGPFIGETSDSDSRSEASLPDLRFSDSEEEIEFGPGLDHSDENKNNDADQSVQDAFELTEDQTGSSVPSDVSSNENYQSMERYVDTTLSNTEEVNYDDPLAFEMGNQYDETVSKNFTNNWFESYTNEKEHVSLREELDDAGSQDTRDLNMEMSVSEIGTEDKTVDSEELLCVDHSRANFEENVILDSKVNDRLIEDVAMGDNTTDVKNKNKMVDELKEFEELESLLENEDFLLEAVSEFKSQTTIDSNSATAEDDHFDVEILTPNDETDGGNNHYLRLDIVSSV